MQTEVINILNNIVKTIISLFVAFAGGVAVAVCLMFFAGETTSMIFGWAVGLCIICFICPADTKNWIKNWTKPSEKPLSTTKTDEKIVDLQNEIKNLSLTLFDMLHPNVITDNSNHEQIETLIDQAVSLWMANKGSSVSLLDAMLATYNDMQKTKKNAE